MPLKMPENYNSLIALLKNYPYFACAALKAIPLAPDEESRNHLKRIVAANVGSPTDLREILGLNSESLADFYPEALPPKLSTDDTINAFLDRFGNGEDPSALPISSAPADDYPSSLLKQPPLPTAINTANPPDATDDTINAFLRNVPPPEARKKSDDRERLTEGFAKILIKNGNYAKALEIITELNLKNPEKSVYFADQIRFLKKLIINQSKK